MKTFYHASNKIIFTIRKCALFIFIVLITTKLSAQINTWQSTSTPPGGSVWSMATIGNNLFAGGNGAVYFSSDMGANWIVRALPDPSVTVFSLISNGNNLFVGTNSPSGAVYKTSDNGVTWADVTPSGAGSSADFRALLIVGTDIYASTFGGNAGVFKSPLSAISPTTWVAFNTPSLTNVRSLTYNGTNVLAGTYGSGVWASPIASPSWAPSSNGISGSQDYIQALAISGPNVFAGNIGGGTPLLYKSADYGVNWTQSSTNVFAANHAVYSIFPDGNDLYIGTELGGAFLSTDNGVTWSTYNNGLTQCQNIRSFVKIGDTLFAGTDCGVWRTQIASPTCSTNVGFTMQKDNWALPAIVWNAIPSYPLDVTSANWSWGDGSSTPGLFPSHTYSAAGLYSICVTITVTCGATATACFNSNIYKSVEAEANAMAFVNVVGNGTITGIKKNNEDKQDVVLFPNPNNGEFNLSLGKISGKFIISVYNLVGKEVYRISESVSGSQLTKKIDVSELGSGTYFISLSSGGATQHSKMIIAK